MDSRIEVINEAIAKANLTKLPEMKLEILEEALCSPGVNELLSSNPTLYKKFQTEYLKCTEAVARELTGLNRHLYAEIDELESVEVKKQKYGYKVPLSHRMVTITFNNLSQHVTRKIVSEENIDKRTVLIERWINIAKHAFDTKDFNTCFAIMSGINSSPVFRLKATKEGLSANAKEILDLLSPLLSSGEATTLLMSRTGRDIVPYYGTYRTTLTFTLDKLEAARKRKPLDIKAVAAEEESLRLLLQRLHDIKSYLRDTDSIRSPSDYSPLQIKLLQKTLLDLWREMKEEKALIESAIEDKEAEFVEAQKDFFAEKGPQKSYDKAKNVFDKSKKDEKATQTFAAEEKKYKEAKEKFDAHKKDLTELVEKRKKIISTYEKQEQVLREKLESLKPFIISQQSEEKSAKIKQLEMEGEAEIDSKLSAGIEPRGETIPSSKVFMNLGTLIISEVPLSIIKADIIAECVTIMKDFSSTSNSMRGNNIKIDNICKDIVDSNTKAIAIKLNSEIEDTRLYALDAKREMERQLASGIKKIDSEGNKIETIIGELRNRYAKFEDMIAVLKLKQEIDPKTIEAIKFLEENIAHAKKIIDVFEAFREPLYLLNNPQDIQRSYTSEKASEKEPSPILASKQSEPQPSTISPIMRGVSSSSSAQAQRPRAMLIGSSKTPPSPLHRDSDTPPRIPQRELKSSLSGSTDSLGSTPKDLSSSSSSSPVSIPTVPTLPKVPPRHQLIGSRGRGDSGSSSPLHRDSGTTPTRSLKDSMSTNTDSLESTTKDTSSSNSSITESDSPQPTLKNPLLGRSRGRQFSIDPQDLQKTQADIKKADSQKKFKEELSQKLFGGGKRDSHEDKDKEMKKRDDRDDNDKGNTGLTPK